MAAARPQPKYLLEWRHAFETALHPMLKKRSFSLSRHRTSIALEPEFWTVLARDAAARGLSLAALVSEIDSKRGLRPLASALRVYALAAGTPTA